MAELAKVEPAVQDAKMGKVRLSLFLLFFGLNAGCYCRCCWYCCRFWCCCGCCCGGGDCCLFVIVVVAVFVVVTLGLALVLEEPANEFFLSVPGAEFCECCDVIGCEFVRKRTILPAHPNRQNFSFLLYRSASHWSRIPCQRCLVKRCVTSRKRVTQQLSNQFHACDLLCFGIRVNNFFHGNAKNSKDGINNSGYKSSYVYDVL